MITVMEKQSKDPFVWKFALGFGAFLFLYVMTLTSLPPTLANTYSNFKPGAMICAVSGGGMVGTLLMLKIKVERKRRPILLVLGSLADLSHCRCDLFSGYLTISGIYATIYQWDLLILTISHLFKHST